MSGKAILFTSGKGGVGKTTTTANIAAALASFEQDLSVCVVDMDIGLRNLDIQFGLENKIANNVIDYLEGSCSLDDALVQDKHLSNLYLLPAAQTSDKDAISTEQIIKLINELKEKFDLILIDCPAGIEQGFHNSAVAADEAIIITNPEMSAVRDADRVIGILESYPRQINCWLVVNRLNPDMVRNHDTLSVEDVMEILGIKLLGVIPEDQHVVISSSHGEPLSLKYDNQWAGQAFRNIAKRLTGEEVPLLDLYKTKFGFFNKLKSLFTGKK